MEYQVIPNFSYNSSFKNIYYILSTGALWRNQIGEARISVHFSKEIAPEQITGETVPAGYAIDGDTVTWAFHEIEPTEKDNLRLEFIPFWIFDKMQEYREQIKQDPRAVKPRLELARLYFSTVWAKGAGSGLPYDLDEKRLNEEVLKKVSASADRDYFLSSFKKNDKTGLYRPNFEYTGENLPRLTRLIEILSASGYEVDHPFTMRYRPFMREAETMLERSDHYRSAKFRGLEYVYL